MLVFLLTLIFWAVFSFWISFSKWLQLKWQHYVSSSVEPIYHVTMPLSIHKWVSEYGRILQIVSLDSIL